MSSLAETERYTVPALQRGLQLLQAFSHSERSHTSADLARKFGWPRASVFRMLCTLEQMGFVERSADGVGFHLGLGVLRMGFEYLASMELAELGRPIIDTLCEQTGYSAHVVVRDGPEVVFVAKVVGRNALFHSVQVGARLPAHATVLGRVLLAGHNLAALRSLYPQEPLIAYTAQTPTSRAQLHSMVQLIAKQGFGISQGAYEPGISTIAAPVFNAQRELVAAISITVPAQHLEAAQATLLVAQVRAAAQQLTQRLGHGGAGAPSPILRAA